MRIDPGQTRRVLRTSGDEPTDGDDASSATRESAEETTERRDEVRFAPPID